MDEKERVLDYVIRHLNSFGNTIVNKHQVKVCGGLLGLKTALKERGYDVYATESYFGDDEGYSADKRMKGRTKYWILEE